MVTVERIQRGVSRYLDEQLMPHLAGKDRWIMTGIATLALQRLPQIVKSYSNNPSVQMLGLIAPDGTVDIESLVNSIKPAARSTPAEIPIPLTGGSVTVTEQDLDMILRYILQ